MTDLNDRVAIIGCGKEKLDLDDDQHVPIARLYTSNYFELKREYSKTRCDRYMILSAKHGLSIPGKYVTSYDLTLDDLTKEELQDWREDVERDLELLAHDAADIEVLAGQAYIRPLEYALNELDAEIHYPLRDFDGIGEQMHWLRHRIDTYKNVDDGHQTTLAEAAKGGGE